MLTDDLTFLPDADVLLPELMAALLPRAAELRDVLMAADLEGAAVAEVLTVVPEDDLLAVPLPVTAPLEVVLDDELRLRDVVDDLPIPPLNELRLVKTLSDPVSCLGPLQVSLK